MSHENTKHTRREALKTLGKAAAAAVLVSTAVKKTFAQSSTLSFVVDTYRAFYNSAPQYSWEARIYLYNAGNSQSCVLYFMKEGEAIPANTVNGNSANVYFRNGRLADIREFLRNERPVRIGVVGSNGIATLSNDEYEFIGDADV